MNNEKMREEFESWYLTEYFEGDKDCGLEWLSTEPCGSYRYERTSTQWKIWQASRAAIEVELPPVRPEPCSSGDALQSDGEAATWNIWVGDKLAKRECREAIESAGLKVKP